jgi:hypothetical protein
MVRTGLLMAFALAGCSQAPPAPRNEAGAEPPATATTAQPLPHYLPAYPGATPVEVPSLGGHRPSGNAVAMETPDSAADVFAFYRARLTAAGIPIRADTASDRGGLLSAGRDGDAGVMLSVSRIGNRTRITIIRGGGAR